MKTTARSGEPRSERVPFSKSESRIPAWPFPPARLADRLTSTAVACPSCGEPTPPNRSWCAHCGSVQP